MSDDHFHINHHHSHHRLRQSSSSQLEHHELMQLLEEKDRNIELAAKIGQSLLEQNKELQTKNEFLEESVNRNLDTIIQLKHELNQRIELLRVYANLDDDGVPRSNSDESLRERLKSTKSENERLRRECETLRNEATALSNSEKQTTLELERQLDDANEKITHLQKQIEQKTGELSSQFEKTGQLVKELANKEKNEKMLSMEKDEMGAILIEMIEKHDLMHGELKDMQNQYAELMATFADTESELTKLRQNQNLRTSFDSLYDSLASEMENSESAIPSSRLEIESGNEKDSGVETSLAAEMDRHEKESNDVDTPKPIDYHYSKHLVSQIFCDASTSCTDIFLKTEQLSLQEDTDTPSSSSGVHTNSSVISEDAPSFLNVEASTPIVVRKFPKSPIKANYSKLQRLHSVTHPSPKALSDTRDTDPLDKYDEPKLGQPGIPGTRDLGISLRLIKAREEVQKEFAAFCQRKGIKHHNDFFGDPRSTRSQSDTSWTDLTANYGVKLLQSLKPTWNDQKTLALNIKHGVLTRAELLQSPTTSPQHRPPSLSLSSVPSLKSLGATNGVLQRR